MKLIVGLWFDLDNLLEKLYSPSRKFIERYLKFRRLCYEIRK